MVLALLIATMLQPIGGLRSLHAGETPTDLGPICTKVELGVKQDGDADFSPINDPAKISIDDNTQIRIKLDWELADDTNLSDGDYAEITIPEIFTKGDLPVEAFSGNLEFADEIVGFYKVTESNKLKVAFNEKLKNLTHRKGQVWLRMKFSEASFSEDVIETIKFELKESKSFTIISKPFDEDYIIKKSALRKSGNKRH